MSKKPTTSRKDKQRTQARMQEQARQQLAQWRRDGPRLKPVFEAMIARPSLTTPVEINGVVRDFCASISPEPPLFLPCEPEPWCRQSMCTRNVSEFSRQQGGTSWCGYRIWYNGRDYIEAERHMVWTDGERVRDLSFCADGETTTLFLPDIERRQRFDDNTPRRQRAIGALPKAALAWYQFGWRRVEATMHHATEDEGWQSMPTYAQWLAGARRSNFGMISRPA